MQHMIQHSGNLSVIEAALGRHDALIDSIRHLQATRDTRRYHHDEILASLVAAGERSDLRSKRRKSAGHASPIAQMACRASRIESRAIRLSGRSIADAGRRENP